MFQTVTYGSNYTQNNLNVSYVPTRRLRSACAFVVYSPAGDGLPGRFRDDHGQIGLEDVGRVHQAAPVQTHRTVRRLRREQEFSQWLFHDSLIQDFQTLQTHQIHTYLLRTTNYERKRSQRGISC